MLTSLADTFRPIRRSVDRISEDLRALDTELAAANTAYAEACLDLVEGKPEAEKRKQRAEAERDRLTKRHDDLQAALALAQAREQQKADEAATAERRRIWENVSRLADERLTASRKMEQAAKEYAAAYKALLAKTEAVYVALPDAQRSRVDLDGAILRIQGVEEAARLELLRLGIEWSISYPWKSEIQPFAGKFENATQVVHAWAPKE
jgi:hypothetical protein